MPKIAFIGAGSTVFAKSVLGDCMLTPSLRDSHIALYDINRRRLAESKLSELDQQLRSYRDQLEDTKTQRADIESRISGDRDAVKTLEGDISTLKSEIRRTGKDTKRIDTDVARLREKIARADAPRRCRSAW